MTPEEELKALNRTIRQFEAVYKSTKNPDQRDRVDRELKKLKNYRDKLASFHDLDLNGIDEFAQADELDGFTYLKKILANNDKKADDKKTQRWERYGDRELDTLALYLEFFEEEFLTILSETRLKLDFKHSLERDSFYHRFENLRRLFEDLDEDTSTVDLYAGQQHEEDMRKRSFKKKRNVIVEADKFLRRLANFSGTLVEDIENGGLTCLNADDILRFDRIEGRRTYEGRQVRQALVELRAFAREVIEFLNVPHIASQDS
jgi:hypothetical protein